MFNRCVLGKLNLEVHIKIFVLRHTLNESSKPDVDALNLMLGVFRNKMGDFLGEDEEFTFMDVELCLNSRILSGLLFDE